VGPPASGEEAQAEAAEQVVAAGEGDLGEDEEGKELDMSARLLPRECGCKITCNHDGCTETLQTGQILKGSIRVYAASQGWGRGLLDRRKRFDLCPKHYAMEQVAEAERKEAWAKELKRREDKRRLAREAKAA
jgi:hypothetical protein